MKTNLKNLSEQVIVLTGASSGIGLVTARLAAKAGARLVLAARSEGALRQLTAEINQHGPGHATYVVADVSRPDDVRRIAEAAQQHYGGFDTWINNAGISIYGRLDQLSEADMHKLFDTNFWGLVNGSLLAADHLRHKGGAIINVGSILSDITAILQTMYSASKHAVKGFTDGLRMELGMAGAPVAVTLIQPAAIDTPYTVHAKNYLDREPQHAPPAYAPDLVARAILQAAAQPIRDVVVGGAGKAFIGMEHWTPGLLDTFMEKVFAKQEKSDQPPHPRAHNGLDRPSGTLQERGNYPGHTRETSLYTAAVLRPVLTSALLLGASVGIAALLGRGRKNGQNGQHGQNGSGSIGHGATDAAGHSGAPASATT